MLYLFKYLGPAILLNHWMLLVTDRVIWDSWWAKYLLREGNYALLKRICNEAGNPANYYAHFFLNLFGDPNAASRIFSFIFLAVSGICIYRICLLSGLLSKAEGRLVASLVVAYPGYQVMGDMSIFFYYAGYTLYLVACLVYLQALESRRYPHKVLLHVTAIFAFLLSFSTNSLLVFHYSFVALVFLRYKSQLNYHWRVAIIRLPRKLTMLIVLPWAFWIWKEIFTPRHGPYINYNRLKLDLLMIPAGIRKLMENAILAYFRSDAGLICLKLLAGVAIIVLLINFFRNRWRSAPQPVFNFRLVVFGGLSLFLAALPYILVTEYPYFFTHGWGTKNSLLVALPVALIITGAVMHALRGRWIPNLPRLLIVTIFIVFAVENNRNYLNWELQTVKENSYSENARSLLAHQPYTFLEIRDCYKIPDTVSWYPDLVWSYQFGLILQRLQLFAAEIEVPARDCATPDRVPGIHGKYPEEKIRKLIVDTTLPDELIRIGAARRQGVLTITGNPGAPALSYGDLASLRYLKWSQYPRYKVLVRQYTKVYLADRS